MTPVLPPASLKVRAAGLSIGLLCALSGCARTEPVDVQCRGAEAMSADLPSRVIYEQTGFAVTPYVVLASPADGVFPELGCAHLRSGEIRGRHFRVCTDALPYWEEIHPWTLRQRDRPYGLGDTVYAWYWGNDNPFHKNQYVYP